uniref:Uncharacterized protein n=1 Tax=Helianthus annuus TaxID=4232 RepID=A0A251VNY3_HELAN
MFINCMKKVQTLRNRKDHKTEMQATLMMIMIRLVKKHFTIESRKWQKGLCKLIFHD